MPLLKAEAEKLSNATLEQGLIEEIIDKDELFALLPFQKVNSKVLNYTREKTISEGTFIDPNEAVPEEASTNEEVNSVLRILIGDVDVDKFLAKTMSDVNDQVAVQILQKAKGMGTKFRRTIAIGDNGNNAKEFDGVKQYLTAGQTLSAGVNGAALSFDMLDELLDAVPNGADAIMMRSGTLRAYRALLRLSGGNTADIHMIENFGKAVPAHNGTPIIINNFLPGNETKGSNANTASIYALRMNEADGFHALYGGDTAGIAVEPIGTVQNKDAWRFRTKWYCGTALKSTRSVAAIQGVTNI